MKKILVIDDDLTFVATIKASLDSARYAVTSAGNGIEGLEKIAASRPDLILLDINMPKMDGLAFLKEMNEKYGSDTIPVLVTSNITSLDTISDGISLGVRGYFIKSNESLAGIARIIDGVFVQK
ncbi:MAG: response regulator transcription factor [Minisyncoccota bacterium]